MRLLQVLSQSSDETGVFDETERNANDDVSGVSKFCYKFTNFDASWRECELAFDACEVPPKPDYDQQ